MLGQNSMRVYPRQALVEYVQICMPMPHCPPTQLPPWYHHSGCMYCVLLNWLPYKEGLAYPNGRIQLQRTKVTRPWWIRYSQQMMYYLAPIRNVYSIEQGFKEIQ